MAFLDDGPENRPIGRPWQAWALIAVALLWLLAEAEGSLIFLPSLAALLDAASRFALPVGLLLIGWGVLDVSKRSAVRDEDSALAALAALQEKLQEMDRMLDSLTGNAWTVKTDMDEQSAAMTKAARNLNTASNAAKSAAATIEAALAGLDARLPALSETAARTETSFTQTGIAVESQCTAMNAMLESLGARAAALLTDSEQATSRMTSVLQEIEETSNHTTQLVANRAYALDGAVTGVLDRSVAVLDTIREALLGHGHAIEASIKAGRLQLDAVGSEALQQFSTQMDAMVASARELDGLLEGSRAMADGMDSELADRFARIETRLQELRAQNASDLESFATRLDAIRTGNAAILDQIQGATDSVGALQQLVSQVEPMMESLHAAAGARLPEAEESVGRLNAQTAQVRANIIELEATAANCAALIERLTAARAAEEAKFDALVNRFAAAKLG